MALDPTYGYTLPMLRQVGAPPPPDDFAEFWTGLYERARIVDPAPVARPSGPDGALHDVEFTSLDGIRVGGWLSLPADGRVERGLVVGHGYGGRAAPDAAIPVERAAVLYLCSRGMPARGRVPGIPDTAREHVLHGIAARDTYVHGGCAADVWCAVSALCRLVPQAAARVDYLGGSFGGGIGALAVPWDERIRSACLVVPSFGNHPLRLTLPCTGSGEAVRRYARDHPEVRGVLSYFDAATAATFLRVPTHVGLALADPAVPPPGQFAVYNALAGPRERFLLTAGHTEYAGKADEARALLAAQHDFLTSEHDR
ncbi:acetylxylan esterase [Plantactinospora sp. DSM 117369]